MISLTLDSNSSTFNCNKRDTERRMCSCVCRTAARCCVLARPHHLGSHVGQAASLRSAHEVAQHTAQLNGRFCIQGVLVRTERRSVTPLTCSAPLHGGVHQLISTTDNGLWPRKRIREKGSPAMGLFHQAACPLGAQRAPIPEERFWPGPRLAPSLCQSWLVGEEWSLTRAPSGPAPPALTLAVVGIPSPFAFCSSFFASICFSSSVFSG